MNSQDEPIFSLYKLTIDPQDKSAFQSEGVNNLITSHRNELGTLFMCATREDETGEVNYIFELYKDAASYQVHAASPQFQRYAKFAQKTVQAKEITHLNLKRLLTDQQSKEIQGENPYVASLLEVTLDPNKVELLDKLSKNTVASFVSNLDTDHWIVINIFPDIMTMKNSKISQKLLEISHEYELHYLKIDTMVSQANLILK